MNLQKPIVTLVLITALTAPLSALARDFQPSAESAEANSAGDKLLQSLVSHALENNTEIAAAYSAWQAALARVKTVSALPDPTVGYAYMGRMQETVLGPQKNIYEFEQDVPFPAKLSASRRAAEAEADFYYARYLKTRQDTAAAVTEVYAGLFVVDANLKIAEESAELLEEIESSSRAKYEARQDTSKNVIRAQTSFARNQEAIYTLREERQSLQARLNSLLNRDPATVVSAVTDIPSPEDGLSLEVLEKAGEEFSPEIQEALALEKQARQEVRLSRWANAPDFKVGFQYTEIGDGTTSRFDDGRDAWMIPVKVIVPLWRKRVDAQISGAQQTLTEREIESQSARRKFQYDVQSAYYAHRRAGEVVSLYQSAILPQAEMVVRTDQAGYEAGQVNLSELLESRKASWDARKAFNEALGERLKTFARLQRAVGKSLWGGGREDIR